MGMLGNQHGREQGLSNPSMQPCRKLWLDLDSIEDCSDLEGEEEYFEEEQGAYEDSNQIAEEINESSSSNHHKASISKSNEIDRQ